MDNSTIPEDFSVNAYHRLQIAGLLGEAGVGLLVGLSRTERLTVWQVRGTSAAHHKRVASDHHAIKSGGHSQLHHQVKVVCTWVSQSSGEDKGAVPGVPTLPSLSQHPQPPGRCLQLTGAED